MSTLLAHNFNPSELMALNRVRIHQQALFLSDVLEANGKRVDERYRSLREPSVPWSLYLWPRVYPTRKDEVLWRQALDCIAPAQQIQDRLGKWRRATHKLWPWSHDEVHNHLYHQTTTGYDRYGPASTVHAPYQWYHYACVERNAILPFSSRSHISNRSPRRDSTSDGIDAGVC